MMNVSHDPVVKTSVMIERPQKDEGLKDCGSRKSCRRNRSRIAKPGGDH
jgi:hypothetical protein